MSKFFWIFAVFLLFSCQKNEKKKDTISKSIDYTNLNSFVQDSLPVFDVLDLNYSKVFLLWKDIETIKKASEITKSDPRTLTFFLETLQSDIEKINEDQIPNELNIPQVIGRFRVFKTHVLKINAEKINFENFNLFKSDLKKIVISYNSLLKMINKISKESLDK
tara:strand:- start:244 stop:735 length:492 start_codon:yes stop_codon:yes gene_type:complete